MKSFFENKTWVALLALAAFAGLVILASGLGDVQFGQPFAPNLRRNSNFDFSDVEPGSGVLWMRYLVPGLLLLMFLLALGPARPQQGDSLMKALIRAIGFILFFSLVFTRFAKESGLFPAEALAGIPAGAGEAAIPEFAPPELSGGWAFWIAGLLLLILSFAAVHIVNHAFERWYKPAVDLNEIADIARGALSELTGSSLPGNVIVRCYLDMNKAVGEKRGLVREAAMTPAEFAARLEGMGLPSGDVHGLTGVFERVRYGGQEASPGEIEEAKRCLTGILEACETKK